MESRDRFGWGRNRSFVALAIAGALARRRHCSKRRRVLDRNKKAGGQSDISGGATQHAVYLAMGRLYAVISYRSHYHERHCLIVTGV